MLPGSCELIIHFHAYSYPTSGHLTFVLCCAVMYIIYMCLKFDLSCIIPSVVLAQAPNFEVYITYCENKPKSESFIWTYLHTGGTFFEVRTYTLDSCQNIP